MKKSFGGLMTFAVIMVILLILVSFIAISFNYARAYRMKNKLLTYIEQYEGYPSITNVNGDVGTINDSMEEYMRNLGFIGANALVCEPDPELANTTSCNYNGTFIYSVTENKESGYNSYLVRVGVMWNIPFISNGNWTISGETEQIYGFS